MVIRPNMKQYKRLYDASYGVSGSDTVCSVQALNDLIEDVCGWHTIENETDKDVWFYAVKQEQIQMNDADNSFVIGYFADANPWEMERCIAIDVWMNTARKLIAENDGIRVLVNPDVLSAICAEKKSKSVAAAVNEEKTEDKVKNVVVDGDESSDSMPSPPPQAYAMQKRTVTEVIDDEDDDLTSDDEVANVLQPRGFDDDDE